ncbi:MAG: secretin N-terminal domain-containing protein [Alphaproteobacteria bacterium]|nr:secretin N-terminal domain-containing protein [Alphaproteobacteria bacterium]
MSGLTREDYMALRNRRPIDPPANEKTLATPLTPEIPPIPKLPGEDEALTSLDDPLNKLVSVSVSDSVPVRDLLMELIKKTGANLELDPRVHGNVILTAHDQPFRQVLERLCALADLRYTVEGAFLHIEPDEPYQKAYRLDYLSLVRNTESNTSVTTNVFDVDIGTNSSGARTTSSSAENNSTAKVEGKSRADLWAETEKSIAQILGDTKKKTRYSIDTQAGIISIFATDKQHKAVTAYLDTLRRKASAQVLIDARILEVELDETYQSGIDWGAAFKDVTAATSFGTKAAVGTNGWFTAGVSGSNFSGILNLVQTFGTTRVLSAPRITVLNNQTAVLKVATNQVYFITEAQFTTTTNANGSSITTNPVYTSTPRTVPVGLVMTVQPSIDLENNRITMTLRPTISRIVGQVSDPSIGLNAAVAGVTSPVDSQIPVLSVREMDSVIQLSSGEIAIMGGLMQDSSINTDNGVPGLADVSWIGNLFKSRDNEGKTSELVVLLRATISDQPVPHPADDSLYEYYNRDPRPLAKTHRTPSSASGDPDDNVPL